MNAIFTRFFYRKNFLVLVFSFIFAPGFTQNTATLNGIVTNCFTGAPVVGAKVAVGTLNTFSVFGGIYSLSISPPGTYSVTCLKTGFDLYVSNAIVFGPGVTINLPICLNENLNPPALVVAALDSTVSPPIVDISWQVPRGDYELLYDDGIMDNFTVWAVQGNLNAVKFTPLGFPVTVTGGKINIGTSANYPAGSTPFVPFQVSVYDASGAGGTPGIKIAGPVDVIPMNFGWVDFSIPSPPVINNGNFFLVMTQGGNAPNAAGLAIDETFPQFRSYSRFVTSGSSPWIPASGNFMMRAVVNGPGGPGSLTDAPLSVVSYTVSRLRQGEEQNPLIWMLVGSGTATLIHDNTWSSLPCGPYRWAAQATYAGNRISAVSFSGVIGKCWTVNTTVKVTLSCDSASNTGVTVSLRNLVYTDTLYVKQADTSGTAFFPKFWKGSYELKVSRFGYQDFIQNFSISTDTTLHVFLLQSKTAPSDLFVNDSSLMAHWSKPAGSVELFRETWQSASFSTNDWTVQGPNWGISTAIGKPIPSAIFSWSPPAMNYDQSLISKPIIGQNSSVLRLEYDVFLNNYGTTTLNQLAVEIWDGSTWHLLRNYTNSLGDIQWTTQDLDISSYTALTFKIRFRAYGVDSYDINNWNIDNIVVEGRESPAIAGDCVLGYNFYLNNILCGFTPDTFYQIPNSLVQYGNPYNACVAAIYGSGPSAQNCYSFISRFLPPPANLQGTGIEDAAYLTWNKPDTLMKSLSHLKTKPPGLTGYIIYRATMFMHVASPSAVKKPRARLVLVKPDGSEGTVFSLAAEKTTLGRSQGVIMFPKDSFISPRHAEIQFKDSQLSITDLDSLNGVYRKMTEESRISPGTYFRIGRQLLRLEVPGDFQPLPGSPPAGDDSQFWGSPVPQVWSRLVQVLEGGKIGEIHLLTQAEVMIGREEGEVRFPEDGFVSSRHCLLTNRDGDCFLRDLGSSNGTYLRILGSMALAHDDRIQIGNQVLRVDMT